MDTRPISDEEFERWWYGGDVPEGERSERPAPAAATRPPRRSDVHRRDSASGTAWGWAAFATAATTMSLGILAGCGGSGADSAVAPPAVELTPALTWTYVPTPESRCANGSETGFAVNRLEGANTVIVYLQGGGACFDAVSCLALDTAAHFNDTVQKEVVLQEAGDARMAPFLDRSRTSNPFRAMSQVYIPYCTADLHAGTRVAHYSLPAGSERDAWHVGALNMDAFLARMKPLLPNTQRVLLVGVSGGGYGALLNWERVRTAFGPDVRVDVVDDSGPPIDPSTSTLWETMRDNWGLSLPAACKDCAQGPSHWLPYYTSSVPAPSRFALLAHRQDAVIGAYLLLDAPQQASRLDELQAAMGERQKLFQIGGADHTLLDDVPRPVTTSGVELDPWLAQMLADEPAWAHAGP